MQPPAPAEIDTTAVSPSTGPVPRIHLHMPVDIKSASLALIAVLATIFFLSWAKAVLVPLLLGVIFSYALSPAVDWLQRLRVPRSLGITLVMSAVLAGTGGVGYALADDAVALVESLPAAAEKLRREMRATARNAPESPIEKVQRAASNLEQAAEESSNVVPPSRGVTRVQIEKPKFNVKDYLLSGTIGFMTFVGQAVVVLFIVFFLVSAGDSFRRKMVKIAGPTLRQKKVTLQVLDEINAQIQRYLAVQIHTSILVGIVTGLAVWALGLERAAVWGVVAGVLNLIPYIGSAVVAAALALAGFVQVGTIGIAVQLAAASIGIHIISGNLLAPLLTSRACRINPIVVFVGVLAFGWLWGMWGLLLGAPILMGIKTVCDHIDELNPIGELLGV
ncbi:AI-2E family transporter [Piscinibacter sakaiensis]|uniref:AI-2E family transporter n=1 Tax=Piscinibacter sakaiensis TaxID=1547922 RepID=UPI003AADAF68